MCDPSTGTCSNRPVANGTPCDDGDPCTTGSVCGDGLCLNGTCTSCSGTALGGGQVVTTGGGTGTFALFVHNTRGAPILGGIFFGNREKRCAIEGPATKLTICPDHTATIEGTCGANCKYDVNILEAANRAGSMFTISATSTCQTTAGLQKLVNGFVSVKNN